MTNFNSAFFPRGTVFRLSEYAATYLGNQKETYETHSLSMGFSDLIINTTEFDKTGDRICFAVSHIESIVKYGNGQIVWDIEQHHDYYKRNLFAISHGNVKQVFHVNSREIVRAYCICKPEEDIDFDDFGDYLQKIGVIQRVMVKVRGRDLCMRQFNAKKLKRAIAQNRNRFLVSSKVSESLLDELDAYLFKTAPLY